MDALAAGLHADLPAAEYHGCHFNMTQTKLRTLPECPLDYYRRNESPTPLPDESTPGRVEGSVLHLFGLEPDSKEIDDIHVAPNVKRNTKEGKALWLEWCENELPGASKLTKADIPCEIGGQYLVDEESYTRLSNVGDALHADPAYTALFKDREAVELSFAWEDDDSGILCRGRADLLTKDGILVDLKTTVNPLGLERMIYNWKWPIQAAFYLDGLQANNVDAQSFIWVVCERTWPHPLIGVFECTPPMIEWGRAWYTHALDIYRECSEAGAWPGLSGELVDGVLVPNIRAVELPRYAVGPDGSRWDA